MVARSRVTGPQTLTRAWLLLAANAAVGGAALATAAHLLIRPWLPAAAIIATACLVVFGAAGGAAFPSRDRETATSWLRLRGPVQLTLNGLALGTSLATRLRYWTFAPLVLSFALQPSLGAATAVGALYGALRISASAQLTRTEMRSFDWSRHVERVRSTLPPIDIGVASALSLLVFLAAR